MPACFIREHPVDEGIISDYFAHTMKIEKEQVFRISFLALSTRVTARHSNDAEPSGCFMDFMDFMDHESGARMSFVNAQ